MPIFDKNISNTFENLDKEKNTAYNFSDGGFYPFLKYLLLKITNYNPSQISIKDYGENNPFLEQSKTPKIYCELVDFYSRAMSSIIYSNGNTSLMCDVVYSVYFANDNFGGSILLENALKGSSDEIMEVTKDYKDMYQKNTQISLPEVISMRNKRVLKRDDNIFPIISIDIFMRGKIYFNIEKLRNKEYDDIEASSILYTK